ncbi:MAG: hypothetical protein QXH03_11400 [Candidatus Bathyarchaeia archaeon]
MDRVELLKLLWAIFLAEGGCKASVPFGYLPLKRHWQSGKISFMTVMKRVAYELKLEFQKWQKACADGKTSFDFVRWLARVGYNANPKEWDQWENNVRHFLNLIEGVLK